MKGPILIVDDEIHVREALTDILETVGMAVMSAQNAAEGIQLYHNHAHEIELVILDMRLPEMNGMRMLYHLRGLNPKLRAIVASGYDMTEIRTQLAHDANVHVLQKPFSMDRFLRTVRQALD
jgi:two-component system, cell cycle sensor histidine kinase and response regulator CckA